MNERSTAGGQQRPDPGSPAPGDFVVECRHAGSRPDDSRVVLLRWRLDDKAALVQATFFSGDAISRFEDAAMDLAHAAGTRAWRRVATSGFESLIRESADPQRADGLCVWSLAGRGGRCYNATVHEERGGWDVRLTAGHEILETQRHATIDDALHAAETLRLATARRRRR